MATTEALSREQMRFLARIAAGERISILDTWDLAVDLATPLASMKYLITDGFDTPLRLTEAGWAALKEYADAQGDL